MDTSRVFAEMSEENSGRHQHSWRLSLAVVSILLSLVTAAGCALAVILHVHDEILFSVPYWALPATIGAFGLAGALGVAGLFSKRSPRMLSLLGIVLAPTSCAAMMLLFPTVYVGVCSLFVRTDVEDSFERMNPANRAVVQYSSSGCFHKNDFQLEFEGSAPDSVTIARMRRNRAGELEPGEATSVPLSRSEAKSIDDMRLYFKQPRFVLSRSTSRIAVTIRWNRGSQELMSTTSPDHMEPFLVLTRLIEKARLGDE